MKIFNMAMLDFGIRRLLLYSMVHTFKDYMYLPRVIDNFFSYVETIDYKYFYTSSNL